MSTTRNIERCRGLALSALLLCGASAAQAVPLFYSGTSVVPFGYPTSPYFGGAGTVLTAAITFEVSPGTPSTAKLLSATGTVTWNDGVDRVFTVSDVSSSSFLSIKGWYALEFHGTGPSIGSLTMTDFLPTMWLEKNLQTTPLQLSDLLISGQVSYVYAQHAGSPFGTPLDATVADVTGAGSIPGPSTLSLMIVGLAGLGFVLRRRGSPRPVRRGTRAVRQFDCRTH